MAAPNWLGARCTEAVWSDRRPGPVSRDCQPRLQTVGAGAYFQAAAIWAAAAHYFKLELQIYGAGELLPTRTG